VIARRRTLVFAALGGSTLTLACGANPTDENVAQGKDAIWWGTVDTVANNAPLPLDPVTQPQLNRTVAFHVTTTKGKGSCTGTLLTYQVLLTAAHCIESDEGPIKWPETAAGDSFVNVGVGALGVDRRYLALPPTTLTVPWVQRVSGPWLNTNPQNRDMAVVFLERPEVSWNRRQATVPMTTLDDVMAAADPAFNLPTSSIGATGSREMVFIGYGLTEGAYPVAGNVPFERRFSYLNPGIWEHRSATNVLLNLNANNVAYPDQPLTFHAWSTGLGNGGIEAGYYGVDHGDSGGPIIVDTPQGRQQIGIFQSGVIPNEFQKRPNRSTSCVSEPDICQETLLAPACYGPDGTGETTDDRISDAGNCIVCVWLPNGLCDSDGDAVGDYLPQSVGVPNVKVLRPGFVLPAEPTEDSCLNDPGLCQPTMLPRSCYGGDGVWSNGSGDDMIWLGTYDAANNAECVACTWSGQKQCYVAGSVTPDYDRQRPARNIAVDLSASRKTGSWCPPAPQVCDPALWDGCGAPGVCEVVSPRAWLLDKITDKGRPGRLYGERDYVGPCRTIAADTDCDRNFDTQGPTATLQCPNFFDAEAGFVPELRQYPPAIYGAEGVDLHDRVLVKASPDPSVPTLGIVAAGKGKVLVRNDVQVGRIWGGDHMEAHWRSTWTQAFLNPGGTYSFIGTYPPAMNPVAGAIMPSLKYTARPTDITLGTGFPTWDGAVGVAAPRAAVVLQNCQANTPPTAMGPGSYLSALTVSSFCRASFTAGKYYFDSLTVEPDAQLRIDHSGGAVEIFVRSQLNFKGTVTNAGGYGPATVLSYFGFQTTYIPGRNGFSGTLVAPNATLDLGSGTYSGAFYAKKVVVHQDARVLFNPCSSTLTAPPP
jgi:hypothetical protein